MLKNLLRFLDYEDSVRDLNINIASVFFSTTFQLILNIVVLQNTRPDQIKASQ